MKVLYKLKLEFENIYLTLHALIFNPKDSVINKVPYVSQFAHREYAEKILRDKVKIASDPNWKDSGAESPEEYATWVLTMCGMACTLMALQHIKGRKESIVTLAKDAKSC